MTGGHAIESLLRDGSTRSSRRHYSARSASPDGVVPPAPSRWPSPVVCAGGPGRLDPEVRVDHRTSCTARSEIDGNDPIRASYWPPLTPALRIAARHQLAFAARVR